MGRGFCLPELSKSRIRVDFWAPVTLSSRLEGTSDVFGAKDPQVLWPVLRLTAGISAPQARAALQTWAARETATLPDSLRWLWRDEK